MAGSFSSANKKIKESLRRNGALLVNKHAFAVLKEGNRNVPQVSQSLGYATDALKDSGHVLLAGREGASRNGNAYDLAISDAIYAREENRAKTVHPDLVEPLTRADFLPPYELPAEPTRITSAVYYPVNYAMRLEMGYTFRGEMHPQAFFLMRAMMEREAAFFDDAKKLLELLSTYDAPPLKVPLTAAQKDERAMSRYQRSVNAQFNRENGQLGKYAPFESFGEMVEWSGEKSQRIKGETMGERMERIRNSAIAAFEGQERGSNRRS